MYENDLITKFIELESIFLDPNNPRFTDITAKVSDTRTVEDAVQSDAMVRISKEGVEELIGSILHNGFLPLDRVVVRELSGLDGKYVVVEGNRRIAALKTIQKRIDTAQIDESEFSAEYQQDLKSKTRKIACLVYIGSDTSDIAWILQGIRHISGIRDWTPAQRAELVSREIDDNGLKPRQVAQMLGITTNQVNRLYRANRGLKQMFNDDEFGSRAKKEYFTLFEEAHNKRNIRRWLDWKSEEEVYSNEANLHIFYELISPDPDNGNKRRIHDPRQMNSLDRLLSTNQTELIDKVINYELTIDEARGRMDESESQVNWKEQIERASKALDHLPATSLASQPHAVKQALEKLKSVIDTLIGAAAATDKLRQGAEPE